MTAFRRPLALRPDPVTEVPATAMVMAAGIGKRMRPLTATRPKPLVEVAGRTLLDHTLDHLRAAGVKKAVVNVHYLPDALEALEGETVVSLLWAGVAVSLAVVLVRLAFVMGTGALEAAWDRGRGRGVLEWRERAERVSGAALACGHYIPEEASEALAEEALQFFV